MKRDWDLFQVILAHFETETIEKFFLDLCDQKWIEGQYFSNRVSDNSRASRVVYEHLILLIEAGYVKGVIVNVSVDGKYSAGFPNPQLTNDGHDFLQSIRSRSIWNTIKELAQSHSIELSLSIIKSLTPIAIDRIFK